VSSYVARVDPRALARRIALPRVDAAVAGTLAFGALLAAVALEGQGGLQLGPLTTVEIGLQALAGMAAIAALIAGAGTGRAHGAVPLALFGVLLAFTAASISWAVEPGDAWVEANRTLAWFATFALGFTLVRLAPQRWDSLAGGLILAAVIVCGYAVLTKVFPGALSPDEVYARLRAPFGYWNSVGLMAAMAAPACLWLGARRSGHAAINALAYPALGLMVVACLLAYSRGALLGLAAGCAFWFAVVPLRLRGLAVLATGGFGGFVLALWAFGQDALSKDRIALAERVAAGHQFGVLIVAMLLILLVAGLAIGFALAEHAPSQAARRRIGAAALVCTALVPVAFAGSLATSERGFGGSISKAWTDLTDPNASTPANDPTRLTAIGSVRARYWDQALKIWRAHEAVGVGAGGYRTARLRYRNDTLVVRHAHGYIVQTMADLGVVGLLISLALLAAWLASAGHATGLTGRSRRAPWTPERVGLLTLFAVVIVFGVHSLIDWTWFVPGNVVPALLCAGWLAGRGPLVAPPALRRAVPLPSAEGDPDRESDRPARGNALPVFGLIGAVAVAALASAAAWTTWQPERSVTATDAALVAVEGNRLGEARARVRDGRAADPLSLTPLFTAATVEVAAGNVAGARRLHEAAVREAPSSPEPWLQLAQFELDQNDPRAALRALGPALYLDPRSSTVQRVYLLASRAETGRRAAAAERRAERSKKKP
jgi:hypothetical protein